MTLLSFSHSELIADDGGFVCGRSCNKLDIDCYYNTTKTVSWQFLSLPTIAFVKEPLTILNIKTIGYSIYPNLHLEIIGGNTEGYFRTEVEGDRAYLKLLRPLYGPDEFDIAMRLENRDFSGTTVITRHITHAVVYVSEFPM